MTNNKIMEKIIKLLCCVIPFKKVRKYIRNKLICIFTTKVHIIIHKKNGKIIHNPFFLKGFKIQNNGFNNVIEFYEPVISENSVIRFLGDNNKIILKECSMRSCDFCISCGSELSVDEKCTLEHAHFNLLGEKSKINIGKDCMMSGQVTFWSTDGHLIYNIDDNKIINYSKGINIGNHVWFGQNACILKGVTIPDNCIVGARSVVTKKFLDTFCAIAGNPAKIVKTGINWDRENICNKKEEGLEYVK